MTFSFDSTEPFDTLSYNFDGELMVDRPVTIVTLSPLNLGEIQNPSPAQAKRSWDAFIAGIDPWP